MMGGVQGGENSGPGSTGPSAADFQSGAAAAAAAASAQPASGTFPVYQGGRSAPGVSVNSGGDVRIGKTFTTVTPDKNSADYINYLISLQASNKALYKQYQTELYNAGYYGNTPPVYGGYSGRDGSAFTQFVNDYGAADQGRQSMKLDRQTPEQFLADQLRIGKGQPGFGPNAGKAPLTVHYSDPAALRGTLQQAAQAALGRDLSKGELDKFVTAFHGKEASAQKADYNNAGSATQPDAGGEAKDFVDQGFTMEEGQRRGATFVDSLNSMLGVL